MINDVLDNSILDKLINTIKDGWMEGWMLNWIDR